jgi:hypothetical protein
MIRLVVPARPRRAAFRGFWLTMGVWAGLATALIVPLGLAGSTLRLAPPPLGESLWVERATLPTAAYQNQFEAPNGTVPRGPWATMATWVIRSGNVWALVLVPFLVLIAALETDDRQQFPAGIYTLF